MTSAIGDAKGVDLNAASAEELDRIGGLGQDRVRRIIGNRPFRPLLGRPPAARRGLRRHAG